MLNTNVMPNVVRPLIVIGVSLIFSITTSITTVYAANKSMPPIMNFLGSAGSPSAKKLPEYYPASFQSSGRINRLRSSSVFITGSTESYSLSPNILVHSMATEFSSIRELRVGVNVGFSFSKGMDNKLTITEIWLLPNSLRPQI